MSLIQGARLGPYEITAQIGAGGMGEVYRATDTNLKRQVAIKVLPESVAGDAERLARFQREAEVLAALNHPNIAQIHGLEKSGNTIALVMELVEGPTLADRIDEGAIPLDEALPIARQIAEALEAAHEQGIIHRDLKPANIKVRADGTVKVLDFGLAKAIEPAGVMSPSVSQSPTITTPAMTQVGMILGTAAYMSPEQARGKPVDKRTDIWAFGCVLYEMLTGRRAFEGEDVTVTLARIVEREADWTALPSLMPAGLNAYLKRCLVKDPRQRVQAMGDVRLALEGAFESAATVQAQQSIGRDRVARWIAVAACVVLAGATLAIWLARSTPVASSPVRLEITGTGETPANLFGRIPDIALTPDGSRLIYADGNQLYVRALNSLTPTPLARLGSAARGVFVSPDGQWVGFFDGSTQIKKVAITGGPVTTVATIDGNGPAGAAWGEDGTIVYATVFSAKGLEAVSSDGGEQAVLTTADRERGQFDHYDPSFLPGGAAVLFTITAANQGPEASQVAVLDLRTRQQTILIRGGSQARFVPTGHLVYAAGGSLWAIGFDRSRLQVRGTPVPVVQNVLTEGLSASAAVSSAGTLAYTVGGIVGEEGRSLIWVDRSGREEPIPAPIRAYRYPRLSPDGTRIALDVRGEGDGVSLWDFAAGTLTSVAQSNGVDWYPVWLPDGRGLVFTSNRTGVLNLFRLDADGSNQPQQLTTSANPQMPFAVTPDGLEVLLREDIEGTGRDLMRLSLSQPGTAATPLVQTPALEQNAELAPSGRWMAYESNESGGEQIHVRPFPDVDRGRWLVSMNGGRTPLWSRDGRELFFLAPDDTLMAAQVETEPSWRSGVPQAILKGPYAYAGAGRMYDVAADGRFLMIKPSAETEAGAPRRIVVVLNFSEELKRLVPTD
jgi:serine/threonine-protein kinase